MTSLKSSVYAKLKTWDSSRAENLKHHLQTLQRTLQDLQSKQEQSKIHSISLITFYIENMCLWKTYCTNSVVDADFVIEKNKSQSYSNHYTLIKNLCGIQAQLTNQVDKKFAKLMIVFTQIFGRVENEAEIKKKGMFAVLQQIANNWIENKYSQINSIFQDLKYSIQFELPDIVQQVMKQCEKVSKIYNNNLEQDFYLQVQILVRGAHKQSNKHREIGKSLVSLIENCIKKQAQIQEKIEKLLENWAQIDGPIQESFILEMKKKDSLSLARQYYSFPHIESNLQSPLAQFIGNFQIVPFTSHKSLIEVEVYGSYNNEIQTKIIVTVDSFMHLIRLNSLVPDFSICLNGPVHIHKNKNSIVVQQFKKKFYFKKQKDFEFTLSFEENEALNNLLQTIKKVSSCKID